MKINSRNLWISRRILRVINPKTQPHRVSPRGNMRLGFALDIDSLKVCAATSIWMAGKHPDLKLKYLEDAADWVKILLCGVIYDTYPVKPNEFREINRWHIKRPQWQY